MSSQITNNNYIIASISPNPYITRKLNNMDKAQVFKNEWDNWTSTYYKTLKGLEIIIDVQKQVRNMMKIAEEANMTITEMEGTILKASINNWTINATNILGILEDLQYLIQSNMCYKTSVWTDFRVRVRTEIRYSSSIIIISLRWERERAHDWEVTWHDVIGLEKSRAVWRNLGSRRIGKSLEIGWHQGTWVSHGVHMVHAWWQRLKSMMSGHMDMACWPWGRYMVDE